MRCIFVLSFALITTSGLPTNPTVTSTITRNNHDEQTLTDMRIRESTLSAAKTRDLFDVTTDRDSETSGTPGLALASSQTRIVGGSATTIGRYPSIAALLRSTTGSNFRQRCGGSIINVRTIVTAAHCVHGDAASRWRFRVGSSVAHSGGRVITVARIVVHQSYRPPRFNADIALLRANTAIAFSTNVQAVRWASSSHALNTGTTVWAAGWGFTRWGGASVEVLRHVQLQIMNQNNCWRSYAARGFLVNANMVCAGWPTGGRDQCQGDSGGPLLHNGVLVRLSSFGRQCGLANYPGVNTRISAFSFWITKNMFRS